jgi:hypothetical protein
MIRLILDHYLSVYNSGETLMPMRRLIGQLPMKRDSQDYTRADLRESDLNLRNVAKKMDPPDGEETNS